MSAVKRKHNSCSLQIKREVLNRLDKGESASKLCREFSVGKATISDWKKNRAKLEGFCTSSSEPVIKKRCSIKASTFADIDQAVYLWFSQERLKGIPISGPIIQAKASEFAEKFNSADAFASSAGWLHRWKCRHGVRQLSVSGEKLSADTTAAKDYIAEFSDIVSGYSPQQVYNADESGLNFKALPNKTLASRAEKWAPGIKMSKERLTIMACSNATGTNKLPLMVLGKSARPRALKEVNMNSLPVCYKNQKKAWMTGELFSNWFHEKFVPAVKKFSRNNNLAPKALLVIDNAPSHPPEKLVSGDIKAIFLPPNVTSVLQPMDQEVLQNIKRAYKKKLLQRLVKEQDDLSLPAKLKKITIKDVIYWAAESWDVVSENLIRKSWKKLWPSLAFVECPDIESDDSEILQLVQELPGCEDATALDIGEWTSNISEDDCENLTDADIVSVIQNDFFESDSDSDSEEDADDEENERVSHSEAVAAFEVALRYIEQNNESTPNDVMFVRRWKSIASTSRYKTQRQTKLTDFLTINES